MKTIQPYLDLDVEVTNLCLVYGCEECPGCQNIDGKAIAFCMHGCHPELQAPRIKNTPSAIPSKVIVMK